MVFVAGKCNFGVVLGLGICTLFLSPTVGFFMNIWPDRGAFAAFPKQNDKCPTKAPPPPPNLELTQPKSSRGKNVPQFHP